MSTQPPVPPKPTPPVKPAAPAGATPAKPAVAGQPPVAAPRPATPGTPPVKPAAPAGAAPVRPAAPGQPAAARPAAPGTPPVKPTLPGATPVKPAAPAAGVKPAAPAGTPPVKPAAPAGAAPVKPSVPGATPARPATPAKPAVPTAARPATPAAKPASPAAKPALKKPASDRDNKGSGGKRKLGQVLVDLGFLDEEQLWELLNEARDQGVQIGQMAVNKGLLTEDQLLQALGEQFGLKSISLPETKFAGEATTLVPETMAQVYKLVPLTVKDNILTVAIWDPNNLPALDDLRNFLGVKEVKAFLSSQRAIQEALPRAYAGKQESIVDIIKQLEDNPDFSNLKGRETSIDLESLQELQDAAPVRKLLNMVMLLAIKDRASDIHFEPFEDEYKMRYRCDGVLYEMVPPPRHLSMAISSRIKVMSNLDIAERRLPQDGRIELNVGGNQVDMRVSVLPTMFGESVVIRVLDRTVVSLDLDKVGMDPALLAQFRELIKKPNGIILITGPTGAGKTTTLYSALNELNDISEKIITTEDPVEYDIDGIIQIPINADIDVTFAAALRAILRHDPDKILVGEIRDLETAQIAVQASLTGHIVFSTLHTNDAPSTITRLRDMGLEPYLITATLEGVMGQRLVRKICVDCRTEYEPSAELLMELNLRPEEARGKKFYYGRGCDRCNNTGHKGRTGIYEFMPMNDELRDAIMGNVSTEGLRQMARKHGMTTLREYGLQAIYNGVTTIEEVVRETVLEDE